MGKLANAIQLLRWWPLQVHVLRNLRTTPRRGRWHLLSLDVPGGIGWDWNLWRRLAPREFCVHTGGGDLWFTAESINGDRGVFGEIFIKECYRSSYRDAVVIDIGAHKGYFGAYALLNGAKIVLSFEPEESNFAALERTVSSFRAIEHDWRTSRVALGSERRRAQLNLSRSSWSHSLLDIPEGQATGQTQEIDVIPLRDILADVEAVSTRTVVKIDTEGAECEIVLGTPSKSWEVVSELFVEVHWFATCSTDQLADHVGIPVKVPVALAGGLLHLVRNDGST